MFRIRASQFHKPTEERVRQYDLRVLEHLKKHFPRRCESLGDEATMTIIKNGRVRASQFRIISQRDVCRYISLAIAISPDFDHQEWALAILASTNTAKEKIDRLYQHGIHRVAPDL